MPIPSSSMRLYYSGSSTKATADGNQGGAISTIPVPDQDLTNTNLTTETMWKNVTFTERMSGVKKYHCFYLKNDDPSLTATSIKIYKSAITTGPDATRIGYAGTVANTLEQALGVATIQSVYDVPLNASEARMDDDRTRAGQSVDSYRSKLYNIAPIQIDAYLIKHGNPSDNSPVRCFVRSYWGGDTRIDFGQVVASSIPTTSTVTTFTNTSNTYKLRIDDIIWFEYKSGKLNDYIAVNRIGTDPISYSHQVNYDGEQIRNVPDFDLSMKVSTALQAVGGVDTIAPTGVTFSNPTTLDAAITLPDLAPGAFVGFWMLLDVPARCPYFLKDRSEIAIVYNS